jgi:hypothetical protein
MNRRKYLCAWTFAVMCAAITIPAVQADPVYGFETLNNPADTTFNQLLGINNGGSIAGYFGSGSATHPNQGYTLVPPTTFTSENFPGSVQTQVVGTNNTGTTVGFWVDNNGNNFGFVHSGATFTSVSDPNVPANMADTTQLLGVNDNGEAVGFYMDAQGNAQGFIYNIANKTFTPVTLPGSFNAAMTTATGINNAGEISGFYVDTGGVTHAFIDNSGTFSSFNDPNANGVTQFLGLNNTGLAVGDYVDANAMTNGLVYSQIANTWNTVNDPLASATSAFGVNGTTINGINDKGQVVGFFSDGTNVNGFLATPTPEPRYMSLLAIALLALLLGRSARRGQLG